MLRVLVVQRRESSVRRGRSPVVVGVLVRECRVRLLLSTAPTVVSDASVETRQGLRVYEGHPTFASQPRMA